MIDFEQEKEDLRQTLIRGINLIQRVDLFNTAFIAIRGRIGDGLESVHYSPSGSVYVKVKTAEDFEVLKSSLTPGDWMAIGRGDNVPQFSANLNGIDFNVIISEPTHPAVEAVIQELQGPQP